MNVCIKLEDVQHGLWVLGVVFLCDGRLCEQAHPMLGQTGEGATDRIKADVDLVHKVGGG